MTSLIQVISDQFLESAHFRLDHQTINSLVVILSHTMEAAVTQQHLTNEKPYMDNNREVSESQAAENTRNDVSSSRSCVPASSTNDRPRQQEESVSAEQTTQAVVDVLHAAADLMLVRPENICHGSTSTDANHSNFKIFLCFCRSTFYLTKSSSTQSPQVT